MNRPPVPASHFTADLPLLMSDVCGRIADIPLCRLTVNKIKWQAARRCSGVHWTVLFKLHCVEFIRLSAESNSIRHKHFVISELKLESGAFSLA